MDCLSLWRLWSPVLHSSKPVTETGKCYCVRRQAFRTSDEQTNRTVSTRSAANGRWERQEMRPMLNALLLGTPEMAPATWLLASCIRLSK